MHIWLMFRYKPLFSCCAFFLNALGNAFAGRLMVTVISAGREKRGRGGLLPAAFSQYLFFGRRPDGGRLFFLPGLEVLSGAFVPRGGGTSRALSG